MADNTTKGTTIPRDYVPREQMPEGSEQLGTPGSAQEFTGSDVSLLEDQMLARQTLAVQHLVPELATPASLAEVSEWDIAGQVPASRKPVSIFRKRIRKFKSLKRGYFAFLLLMGLYLISFLLPLLVNNKPLIIHYDGKTYFPALLDLIPGVSSYYPGSTFGLKGESKEPDYRTLVPKLEKEGTGWGVMPLYPWDPLENDFSDAAAEHPAPPSSRHLFGTDDVGRDVFSRMCYGFNISISFALILVLLEYLVGGTIGGIMGFYGGKVDLFGVRFIEIWANIPFLYTVIIISSIVIPSFALLLGILALFQWIGITYYIRGEFYREKAKDYVAAAIALGASDRQIIFKHILPNSLTPMISFMPFAVVGGISALVSLDFLGFGLPPPTPSWGQMVQVGVQNFDKWWLITTPLAALFCTLLMVTFIGEAIREAFDPKIFSRLR